ncbi:uncharacterized protein N7484_001633 [Penicillium longicatenatum]|uniref:uncharacterized protein n=1 Tax=Penicillium longicatenatum TaxID=1561947 RepID=UPI002547241F|nr:uncharacterized protein N7484_001633 [Penicillium longicatenatum]KAJ5657984.1 hypothetical protein N7484_001633 [Penicillium longicatenatum]
MSNPYELISKSRFHRRVTLDCGDGPLSISFADMGCETGPALLFIPGMFSSRYPGIPLHVIAERAGVRLLVVDRPGMGASTDVPLAQRVAAWTDMLPRLLAHLHIPRVSLVAHSAGTIYLLNTWARCRDYINPVIAVIAPWVDPAHSRVTAMQMAQYVPTKAFAVWNLIPRFIVTQASPVLASSGTVFRRMSLRSESTNETEEDLSFLNDNRRRVERDYGVPRSEQEELTGLALRYMYAENTVGANSEALQCLRKGDSNWGVCSDYAVCAQTLAGYQATPEDRFSIHAYFAAKDFMVGKRGKKYFEDCWQSPGVEAIDFVSREVEGSDHDTIAFSVEVWEEIFSFVK